MGVVFSNEVPLDERLKAEMHKRLQKQSRAAGIFIDSAFGNDITPEEGVYFLALDLAGYLKTDGVHNAAYLQQTPATMDRDANHFEMLLTTRGVQLCGEPLAALQTLEGEINRPAVYLGQQDKIQPLHFVLVPESSDSGSLKPLATRGWPVANEANKGLYLVNWKIVRTRRNDEEKKWMDSLPEREAAEDARERRYRF